MLKIKYINYIVWNILPTLYFSVKKKKKLLSEIAEEDTFAGVKPQNVSCNLWFHTPTSFLSRSIHLFINPWSTCWFSPFTQNNLNAANEPPSENNRMTAKSSRKIFHIINSVSYIAFFFFFLLVHFFNNLNQFSEYQMEFYIF